MKVVVSVGGSILGAPADENRIRAYGETVADLVADGHQVAIITGGGETARQYIETGRTLGSNEISLDELGIQVTRLNARLLLAALGDLAPPTPPTSYEEMDTYLHTWDACVMGGTDPAHTTDAVAAGVAESIGAELLVYATSVPGVFDADPAVDQTASPYERLTPAELTDVVADLELAAGSNSPVDLLAAKIIQRGSLRGLVIDGTDPVTVGEAVRSGSIEGTHIVPEKPATQPPAWQDDD